MSRLRVLIDGQPLPDPQARATWERFSAHMDVHRGDFAGFAAAEGYVAASVAVEGTVPTLSLSSQPPPEKKAERPEPAPKPRPDARPGKAPKRRERGVDVGGQRPRRKKP